MHDGYPNTTDTCLSIHLHEDESGRGLNGGVFLICYRRLVLDTTDLIGTIAVKRNKQLNYLRMNYRFEKLHFSIV